MSFFDTAIECVEETKEILIEGFKRKKEIEYKGDTDLVTSIDKAVEKKVIEIILSHYPNHDILAEESEAKARKSNYRWIIDPVDGTVNFAHGVPHFALSIGLEREDELIVGVVYNPITKELFTCEKGSGAYFNGERIKVSEVSELSKGLIATGFPYDSWEKADLYADELKKVLKSSQGLRRAGVAALDICYVASGRYDGYWERNLKPWDVAGGIVILEEAGGKVSTMDGKTFSLTDQSFLTSNSLIHDELVQVLLS